MKKKLYVTPCVRVTNVKLEGMIAGSGGQGYNIDPDEGAKNEIDMENEW